MTQPDEGRVRPVAKIKQIRVDAVTLNGSAGEL